jgi:hypothetical protein
MNIHVSKEDIKLINKHSNQGNANQNHKIYHFKSIGMAITRERKKEIASVSQAVGKKKSLHTLGRE